MLTTIGLRLVLTTPFYVYQQRCQAKAELLLPELREWAASVQYKELTLAKRKGLSEAEAIKIANDGTKVRVLAVFWLGFLFSPRSPELSPCIPLVVSPCLSVLLHHCSYFKAIAAIRYRPSPFCFVFGHCDHFPQAVQKRLYQREWIWPMPLHALAPILVQIPVWITLSFALRRLATADTQPSLTILQELASEGMLPPT